MEGNIISLEDAVRRLRPPAMGHRSDLKIPRSRDLDLIAVARKLRLSHHSRRTIISKLRDLVTGSGFPLPRNPRLVKGQMMEGASAIYAGSLWDRDDVEIWQDGRDPPPAAAARAGAGREAVRSQLAARAQALTA